MTTRLGRIRHLLIALIALGLTASLASAARPDAMPSAADRGLGIASEAAGKTVPAATTEEERADEEEPEDEPADEGSADEEVTAEEEPAEGDADARPDNHGKAVSEAARGEVPEGYRNRGEYVSEVARSSAGKPNGKAGGQPAGGVADEAKPTRGGKGAGGPGKGRGGPPAGD